MLIIAG